MEKLFQAVMRRRLPAVFACSVIGIGLIGVISYAVHKHAALFNPAGPIARQERNLMLFALALSLLVVIPVFSMLALFAYRYQATNHHASYSPDLAGNTLAESIWWGIPLLFIAILGVVTWNSSHSLDPARPINAMARPLTVQVVALDWKWLFIYPEQRIASVNQLALPLNTPVTFDITADAPMNSFWIPRLGGQIYAMPGMQTQLHLLGDAAGSYDGMSANISGKGFSNMHFTADVVSQHAFDEWVQTVKSGRQSLDAATYTALAQPESVVASVQYSAVAPDLFSRIIIKYTMNSGDTPQPGLDVHSMNGAAAQVVTP